MCQSTDACTGLYGRYLALNNPHKLSLYLTAGLPVAVWSGSAMAEFVRRSGVGLAVNSLEELGDALRAVTPEDYEEMALQAAGIGDRLRRGEYLAAALTQLER